jgi:hypothetical protein
MDELTILRAARPVPADLREVDRTTARSRLMAEIAISASRQSSGAPAGTHRGRATQRRRPGWPARNHRLVLTAAGAAVSAAAAVLLVAGLTPATSAHPRVTSSGPALAARTAGGLSASQVLLLAARSARSGPDLTVGPGQFLYIKQLYSHTGAELNGVHQDWYSWDGNHGGLLETAGKRPQRVPACPLSPLSPAGAVFSCPMDLPFATGMPSTVSGMLSLIRHWDADVWGPDEWAHTHHLPGALAQAAVSGFTSAPVIANGLLYSNSTSALFYQAMAGLSGMSVVSNAVTVAGQHGIGVATVEQNGYPLTNHGLVGYLVELVFDPQTYQLIGVDDYDLTGKFRDSGGLLGSGFYGHIARTFTGRAVLQLAVVSKPGQLPAAAGRP